jgi:hypothetical protein
MGERAGGKAQRPSPSSPEWLPPAAGYAKTSTARPAPEEVTAFLASYDEAHPGSFDFRQQRQVLAAATPGNCLQCALRAEHDE